MQKVGDLLLKSFALGGWRSQMGEKGIQGAVVYL